MNRILYTNTGGLPVTQEHLDFLQQSFLQPFAGVASLLGDSVIISGVNIVAGVAGNGWVVIAGEILPFQGGAVGSDVVISETIGQELFLDGVNKDVYFTRAATFGAGPGSIPFANFRRLSSIKDLTTACFKPGMITMWSGSVASIPEGFNLCDGTNGTPNLSGQFIVGYDATDADYDTIGKIGGSKSVTLNNTQIPPVPVPIPAQSGGDNNDHNNTSRLAASDKGPSDGGQFSLNVNTAGGGLAHENRPPYYTLAYIMKL